MRERFELLGEARKMVGQARLFSTFANEARRGCGKCMPEKEKAKLKEAVRIHTEALKREEIPHKLLLLRGSALHLPLLRLFAYHSGFIGKNRELSERLGMTLPRILKHVKTEPKDIDLVTVGIPQDRAMKYISLANRMRGQPIDITAHLTAEQVANPDNTYSSFFNFFHGFKIPHEREAVNDTKFARHMATVMFFVNAYPLVELEGKKRKSNAATLREIRKRFDVHLKQLSDEQLEEFNRIMSWHIRREAYVLFQPGIEKTERNMNLGRYSPEKSEAMKGWEEDFFYHVKEKSLWFTEHMDWLSGIVSLLKYAGKKGLLKIKRSRKKGAEPEMPYRKPRKSVVRRLKNKQ